MLSSKYLVLHLKSHKAIKKDRLKPFQTAFLLLPNPLYLTATAAFATAAAAVAFFRFEHDFRKRKNTQASINQADDNILSHDDSILEEI